MQRRNRYESEEDEFAQGDSGAALTRPAQVSTLRKGGHVNIKDRPCKIMEICTSKVGKHGHAKSCVVGIDLFTHKRYETIHPTSHNIDVPLIDKTEYVLVDAGVTFLSLMDDKGMLRTDVRVPDNDYGRLMRKLLDENVDQTILVTVLSAMGEDIIIAVKTAKD